MNNRIRYIIIIISLTFMIIGCGSSKAPTGGKKDTVRPDIITITPDQFTDINDQDIVVTFSKQIKKNSIFTGISIYPPILQKKYIWDRNNLIIRFGEELADSTNYFISLNTNIKGVHGNRLDRDYNYVFYSGEPNYYTVEGTVKYETPEDYGLNIIMNLFSADSTFIRKEFNNSYYFKINDLNPADYIVRAYIDKNDNGRYDSNSEPFSYNYYPYTTTARYNLEMTYQDTTKPRISSHKLLDSNQMELRLSESIKDDFSIRIVQDSTEIETTILYKVLEEDLLKLVFADLDTLDYQIQIAGLEDFKNNLTENIKHNFRGIAIVDSLPPFVVSTEPRNGSTITTLMPKLNINFSEIIPISNMKAELWEIESNKQVVLKTLDSDTNQYVFQPRNNLKNLSSYKLILDYSDYRLNSAEEKLEIIFIPILRD